MNVTPTPDSSLSRKPWTPADQAESDVLVNAFVEVAFLHRECCDICRASELRAPWCEPLQDAFGVLLSWRRSRRLHSEARWLRSRQALVDFEQELAG